MMHTSRRSFITGLASFIAAPAIVRAGSLMPVRSMIEPISMRTISEYVACQAIDRLDILYGSLLVRPEWGSVQIFTNTAEFLNPA